MALGLLFGLGIGVGAALLVETASRKVITPSDAEEAADLPFIAAVRKNGTRRTPLPVADRPFSPAAEDYRRVATALERQGLGSDIKVLTIASADPGDGKTMLAANLAHSLARQGRAVVLVSSDLRKPEVQKLVGLGQLPGLAEALQDDPLPAIALLVSINDHLLVLPAGMPNRHPSELLASKRFPETIQTLRQMGTVILDSPAGAAVGRCHRALRRRRRHPAGGEVGRDPHAVAARGDHRAPARPGPAARRGPGRDQQLDAALAARRRLPGAAGVRGRGAGADGPAPGDVRAPSRYRQPGPTSNGNGDGQQQDSELADLQERNRRAAE